LPRVVLAAVVGAATVLAHGASSADWGDPVPYAPCLGGLVAAPEGRSLEWTGLGGGRKPLDRPKGGKYVFYWPVGASCASGGDELAALFWPMHGGGEHALVVAALKRKLERHLLPKDASFDYFDHVLWLDREYIVVAAHRAAAGPAVVAVERATGAMRVLASLPDVARAPGAAVRVAGDRLRWLVEQPAAETLLMEGDLRAAGEASRVLRRLPARHAAVLSPDGGWVAWYGEPHEDILAPVSIAAADGSAAAPRVLLPAGTYDGATFSRDGDRLAILQTHAGTDPWANLFVLSAASAGTSGAAPVAPPPSTPLLRLPVAWSDPLALAPDLERIAFWRPGTDAIEVRVVPGGALAGRVPVPKTGFVEDFAWTPDGAKLLYVNTAWSVGKSDGRPETWDKHEARAVYAATPGGAPPRLLLRLVDRDHHLHPGPKDGR
jgi:hypothetical protein